ncbi:MAG: TPM domain-containing protein [Deltaproteobacteria bacterium]|nr:TPM domain-containing protein [Deltaproteobacteria bacterium]
MTKRRTIALATLCILGIIALTQPASPANFPSPRGAVNDFAGVLSGESVRAMELLAQEVLEKTGTSIVVATVPSVEGADPDDYANRLYEAWGIGKKGEDKGVLIFLALKERRVRIETGYGVEAILTDGRSGEILDTLVIPYLRKGDYNQGLANAAAGVASIIARDAGVALTGGAAVQTRKPTTPAKRGYDPFSLVILLLFLFFFVGTRRGRSLLPLLLFMTLMGGGRGGGFGGFGGGGFGGFGGGMSGGGGGGRSF